MLKYYWSKFIKKLPGSSIKNSSFEKPSKAEARSTIIDSSFGRYSYCGYNCTIINCKIGRFTSISDNVSVGLSHHPIEWVSTSPAFYFGKDSIPKNVAKLEYDTSSKETIIGNDVWIGDGVFIKDGISIGDGAVIGARSVVTKDVPPFAIVAGNPAKIIKMRFSDNIIKKMLIVQWWNMNVDELSKFTQYINNPETMILRISEEKRKGE